jgi:hypothetical protein
MLRIDEQPQIIRQKAMIRITDNFKRKKSAKEKILITTPLMWKMNGSLI